MWKFPDLVDLDQTLKSKTACFGHNFEQKLLYTLSVWFYFFNGF